MADFSQSSFIPKQGATRRRVTNSPRRVYFFTLLSYIILFATLLAAGVAFLYNTYTKKQLEKEIVAFDQEIGGFDEIKLQQVLTFDQRLQQAKGRLDVSVSTAAILRVLEETVIDSTYIDKLNLKRVDDTEYVLTANLGTDTLDSTLFQRSIYNQASVLSEVEINNVEASANTSEGLEEQGSTDSPVTFEARLIVPVVEVLYKGMSDNLEPQQAEIPEENADTDQVLPNEEDVDNLSEI